MAERSNTSWSREVASFCSSPKLFLTSNSVEVFLDELLKGLHNESVHEQTKILMLDLFLEFPSLLFPDQKAAKDTAEILMIMIQQKSNSVKSMTLRCHLLLAIETVLITTDNFNSNCNTAQEFASLLFLIISDINDKKQGISNRPLRITACECLRELETCYPGFLSQRIEKLYSLQQHEFSPVHQSYTLLYSVALKNAIQILAQKEGPSDGSLKSMLMGNESFFWSTTEDLRDLRPACGEQFLLLPSNTETKELKSILALLLEDSYLFTPVAQNSLFWQIIQVVAMVRTISPVIFKSQLVRLFGTKDVSFFHSILQMKAVFTDSLFTAEDENFLLQRLVGMTQHPLLCTPLKLFYLDCLLHFPENRPLNSNPEENLPVLLTPQMTSSLFPTIFNDSSTMLCRQNLLSMVFLENEGFHSERGIGLLFEHMMSLYNMVHKNNNREITTTFFRTVFLFVRYFNYCEKYMESLTKSLIELYKSDSALAPYFINLINQMQNLLEFHTWPVSLLKALQKQIVDLTVDKHNMTFLEWHLKILSRVAQENIITQKSTVLFLKRVVLHSDICQKGDWRTGNAILSVCKHVLQHQHLNSVFMDVANLLQYLVHRFEDIDIQDRARLYYILLTNVSSDKLGKILTMSPSGSQSKTRSLSSIMTESENFSTLLTIQNTEKPILNLSPICKDSNGPLFCSEDPTVENLITSHFLEDYYEQLNGLRSCLLSLKYLLSFKGNIAPKYHKLFCIALQFELTDCNYEPISGINIPCLLIDKEPTKVSIHLVPKEPYPSVLLVTATYSTQDGMTYCTKLEPLHIKFSELFIPLPLPTSWSPEAGHQLFDRLWEKFQPGESSQSEESIFCYEMSEKLLNILMLSYFSNFVISYHSDVYKVGLCLPPQFHILMIVKAQDGTAIFSIRTDNWKFLPYLNTYLLDVTSQK
ncbi:AP-5 complex subunit beta-1 [Bombina bombina]|uniref:AP-5 complex subunit beta-1 n=1 Tax=Bombina bombina TaxID=8345 RepID=UPI00235AB2C6|nr:AP-5 complex subunit beta-1 [Bombina bombina]XP_053546545.1 AP-5 complex subunit beta-1 [Bombina bombina]XP_053546546.1 AP-5 complex subunit beta-1 [Bombina bombina]